MLGAEGPPSHQNRDQARGVLPATRHRLNSVLRQGKTVMDGLAIINAYIGVDDRSTIYIYRR